MQIYQDYDLTQFNTFGIKTHTKFFAEIKNETHLRELFLSSEFKNNKKLFLGGGSNVLFTKPFEGLVILNKLKGVSIVEDLEESVLVRAMGGEVWHDLVLFAITHGYWGIENLAFIPGTVGAAPIQNIGAYGVELKDVLESVEAFEIDTGKKLIFSNTECCLGYRDSFFKNEGKDKYFISAITLRLSKVPKPKITYKILQEYLKNNNIEPNSPKKISDAVTNIRKNKLPDPKDIGNVGSFFKNIFIDSEKLKELKITFPDIPFFEEDGKIKISSAWLIEKCGWKGKRNGNVGVHEKQALVLVNYGKAEGQEIEALAEAITDSVYLKFGLKLKPEVNIV